MAARPDRAALFVEDLGDGHYRVTGGAEPHLVAVHAAGPLCDCKDFEFGRRRGHGCKHVDAVALYQVREQDDDDFDPNANGDGGPGLEPDVPPPAPPEEDDSPRLELVRDPVSAALARIGLDALRSATDGRLRDALLRLGEEAAALGLVDAALLEAEAAKRLTELGESRADALVAAAIAHGRKSTAAAAARAEPSPTNDGTDAPARAAESPPLLRTLAELLADPDALKAPAAVVPRLAYRGRVTLLSAREKTGGKSTLLTAGAAAVTRGADFLGEPCAAGPVLWVTADQEHASDITARAVRFGADPARFHVLWPRTRFADLAAAVDAVQPVLIVIDTLANFAQVEDPHSSAEWPDVLLPLVRLARERALAVVLAHHANKTEGRGYRDSTAIGATVDLILELEADAANPGRRNVKAVGRWSVSSFAVELIGDRYELRAGAALSLEAQVLAFIEANPRCSLRLVRSVGGRAEDVDQALARLTAGGAVRNDGTDRRHAYVSATAPQAPPPAEDEPDDLPF